MPGTADGDVVSHSQVLGRAGGYHHVHHHQEDTIDIEYDLRVRIHRNCHSYGSGTFKSIISQITVTAVHELFQSLILNHSAAVSQFSV